MINDKELNICAKIEYKCWRENFAPMLNISEYLYFQTEAYLKRQLQKILENPDSHIILIHKKEKKKNVIAGFSIVTLNKNRSYYIIDKFFIDPQYQNKKLATSLLQSIINNFESFSISIQVFQANRIAEHLLIKNKFKKTLNRNMNLMYGKNTIVIPTSYYLLERKPNE